MSSLSPLSAGDLRGEGVSVRGEDPTVLLWDSGAGQTHRKVTLRIVFPRRPWVRKKRG